MLLNESHLIYSLHGDDAPKHAAAIEKHTNDINDHYKGRVTFRSHHLRKSKMVSVYAVPHDEDLSDDDKLHWHNSYKKKFGGEHMKSAKVLLKPLPKAIKEETEMSIKLIESVEAKKPRNVVKEATRILNAKRDAILQEVVEEAGETLNELSKKTLSSYVGKAVTDIHNHGYRSAEALGKKDYDKFGNEMGKGLKRQIGVSKAAKKLAQEARDDSAGKFDPEWDTKNRDENEVSTDNTKMKKGLNKYKDPKTLKSQKDLEEVKEGNDPLKGDAKVDCTKGNRDTKLADADNKKIKANIDKHPTATKPLKSKKDLEETVVSLAKQLSELAEALEKLSK